MEIGRVEIGAVGAGDEGRSPVARIVAGAGPLDLDHFGAEIGKQLPGPWTGEDPRELDHAQAGEGLVHSLLRHPGDAGISGRRSRRVGADPGMRRDDELAGSHVRKPGSQ